MWKIVPSDTRAKWRLKTACICTFCLESSLSAWWNCTYLIIKMRPMKVLIRLRKCAGTSESSLGAHARRYAFWRYGPIIFICNTNILFIYGSGYFKFYSGVVNAIDNNVITAQTLLSSFFCPDKLHKRIEGLILITTLLFMAHAIYDAVSDVLHNFY